MVRKRERMGRYGGERENQLKNREIKGNLKEQSSY